MRVVRDVPYLQGANYADDKDKLDLYLPEGRPNAPVIVSYYGNQLMGGDKSEDAYIGRRFASAGFVTAVVNYRLSPGVSHPAHVQDAAASFAWVKRHIAEYGGDPDRVFVIGYSAGGYLAALLSTDPRYLAAHKLSPRDIRGTVPVSAFYWVERPGVAPDRDKSVWGTDRNVWVDASPAHHLRGRRAADADPLRRSGRGLATAAERRSRGGDEGRRSRERRDRDDPRSQSRDDLVARRRRGRRNGGTHHPIRVSLRHDSDPGRHGQRYADPRGAGRSRGALRNVPSPRCGTAGRTSRQRAGRLPRDEQKAFGRGVLLKGFEPRPGRPPRDRTRFRLRRARAGRRTRTRDTPSSHPRANWSVSRLPPRGGPVRRRLVPPPGSPRSQHDDSGFRG